MQTYTVLLSGRDNVPVVSIFHWTQPVFVMILSQWLEVKPCRSVGEELVFNSTDTLNAHITYLHT